MHGEPSINSNDSDLLAAWALSGRQDAFAQLVAQYQRLVLGAALRRTGNVELARDVAQQVFATLAAKARLLLGRSNIAGWLYCTASHLGSRAARAEHRRSAAHDRSALAESAPAADANRWSEVEEAIASLGACERESIVLHYLQDLSYPEMAAALGIAETAARKRVSRALRTLEAKLRSRGVQHSAAALLAGIAAQQSAMATPAGLAAGAITSAATASFPVSLFVATLMSHTTLKIAAGAAVALLVPLTLQWNANARLRERIAVARSMAPVPPGLAPVDDTARLAALQKELEAKRAATLAAERRVAELTELKRKVETEVVYSMGTIESMARKLAATIQLQKAMEKQQDTLRKTLHEDPNSDRAKRAHAALQETARKAAEMMPQLMPMLRELPTIERSQEKAARFYATLYAETEGLDDATRARLETRIASWIEELQQAGLALPQRPKGSARKEWDSRRMAATKTFFETLSQDFRDSHGGALKIEEAFGGDSAMFDLITEGGQ